MTSKAFRRTMMACLCIVLAFMYIPIIAIIGMSFNKTPYGMFPYVFTTQWYKTLFTTSNLLPACILSLKFSFLVTLAAVVIGTLMGNTMFVKVFVLLAPRISDAWMTLSLMPSSEE